MKDPVCGMDVKGGEFVSVVDGRRFLFCSAACKAKFDANPNLYLK